MIITTMFAILTTSVLSSQLLTHPDLKQTTSLPMRVNASFVPDAYLVGVYYTFEYN
jgi:hypothetical protein